jgi:hypothetical protein
MQVALFWQTPPQATRTYVEPGSKIVFSYAPLSRVEVDSSKADNGDLLLIHLISVQVALVWETPPQAVLIVRKPNSSRVSKLVQEVVRWLTTVKKLTVVLEPSSYRELIEGGGSGLRVETWEEGRIFQIWRLDSCI